MADSARQSLEDDLSLARCLERDGDDLEVAVEFLEASDAVRGGKSVGVRVGHSCEGDEGPVLWKG